MRLLSVVCTLTAGEMFRVHLAGYVFGFIVLGAILLLIAGLKAIQTEDDKKMQDARSSPVFLIIAIAIFIVFYMKC